MKQATKNRNRSLACLIRAYGETPNGDVWARAKEALANGASLESAAFIGVSGFTSANVSQAPAPKEAPKKRKSPSRMPVQAQRVREGKVLRDAKGRIVSRETQRALEETLETLSNDDLMRTVVAGLGR